ncbi:MAG: hypothetical protein GY865_14450 [candidate division Zixibacteria bacterium]|nr:hypothetical protein [candidate division Zixibacteria bacterium]
MTSKSMLIIALRIGAIIIAVTVIERVPLYVIDLGPNSHFDLYYITVFVILPNLVFLFFAAIMWFKPYLFLNHVSKNEFIEIKNIDINKFASLLIAILGLYILIFSTVDLINHVVSIKYTKSFLGRDFVYSGNQIGAIVATIVEMVLGLLLIYGKNIIITLIQRFQKEIKDL